jgi:hypothetical protein
VALELSKSVWLIATSAPGSGKVSKYRVAAADVTALLALLARLKVHAERHRGGSVQVASIHEAGLDNITQQAIEVMENPCRGHVVPTEVQRPALWPPST